MRLDPETLDGSPDTGARVLALARLGDAEEALARLLDAKDGEGPRRLPDALLRLAASLRALAPALGGAVPPALIGEVEAAARAAAPSREPEAFAAWLATARSDLTVSYRGALDWLVDRAERRCRRAREELVLEAAPKARRALGRLGPALARRGGSRTASGDSLAAALAGPVRAQTRALREAVLEVAGPDDQAALEAVRAAARRLQDLLEPLRGVHEPSDGAFRALESLRAPAEAFLSAVAAAEAVEGALLEARAEGVRGGEPIPGLRPGLLALLQVAEQRAAAARRELAEPLRAHATPITDACYAAAAGLVGAEEAEAGEAQPPAAPERRFLVTAIPAEAQGGGFETLELGWLPGDERESVGVTRSPLGEQRHRARAAARGRPARVDPLSRAEFDELWPLTEGRRVAKRRHIVPAAPGWAFEEYLDRPLVLAIAEEGNAEEPPAWLEPVLVRDVSAERGYLDEALARRAVRRAGG